MARKKISDLEMPKGAASEDMELGDMEGMEEMEMEGEPAEMSPLETYSDEELLAELERRGLASMEGSEEPEGEMELEEEELA